VFEELAAKDADINKEPVDLPSIPVNPVPSPKNEPENDPEYDPIFETSNGNNSAIYF